MKKQTRRKFSSAFKAKVALEAVKGQSTLAELATKYEINQVIIARWKAEFLANMSAVFEKSDKPEEPSVDTQELHAQIGQLKVENEFLKKASRNLGDSQSCKPGQCENEKNISSPAVRIAYNKPK